MGFPSHGFIQHGYSGAPLGRASGTLGCAVAYPPVN
jgi:hypothetical protein